MAIPRVKPDNALTKIANIASITTTELIAAPGANKKIQVLALHLYSKASNITTFKSATTAITPAWDWNASGGGCGFTFNENTWFECAANEALNLTTTAADKVHVVLLYRIATA